MKKLANHIILSGVTVSMLFSPLMALPSGGKFTHGTSGSISINGKEMNIAGNKQNSIIQWGGGFNIANGEKVNFGNSKFEGQQNYLNIAHGTDKSTIEGVLNAGGNNVFLINPNGVIIEKSGSIINANRFVASTTSLQAQHFEEFKAQGASFSPVFKPKPNGGNVVNMGNINAKNVTLQGNKVMLSADTSWDKKNNKIKLNQITADSIDLKGNEVYVDISTINSKNLTTDVKKGIAYLSATGYYYNPTRKYNDIIFATKGVMDKTYNQYISIGSDLDWWHFAKGWNEKDDFRNNVVGDTFKLTNDIDFKASSGQNYANYWIDLNGDGKKQANEFTNMIVGFKDNSAFTKTFDGQGFTLKNINIDTTKLSDNNSKNYIGLFGKADGANFANINVDYKNGGINASNDYVGGFIGYIDGSVDGISIKNIKYINNNVDITLDSGYMTYYGTGGFAGDANGMFRNIYLDNIQNITVRANLTDNSKIPEEGNYYDSRAMLNYGVGGFAGTTHGLFENIHIKNSGNFELNYKTNFGNKRPAYGIGVGGFTGNATNGIYNGILLQNIKTLKANQLKTPKIYRLETSVGGFAGRTSNGSYENISINKLEKIENIFNHTNRTDGFAGGFAGWIDGGNYNAISVNDIREINSISERSVYSGGFVGAINVGSFNNIKISKIGEIYAKGEDSYSGGFAGIVGATWNSNIVDPYFKNIAIGNINSIKHDGIGEDPRGISGGFAGYIKGGKFNDISIVNIDEILGNIFLYSSISGGFAGWIGGGNFDNISINTIGNIGAQINNSNDFYRYAGGFAGKISSGEFNKISIKDIIEINGAYAGGFAGKIEQSHPSGKPKAIYKNIKIEDINSIISGQKAGGFAGEIATKDGGKFENISINDVKNISSKIFAGGFAGDISGANSDFSFITLNNIENITANNKYIQGMVYSGGFAGYINGGKFNKISLNHIQNIESSYTPENEDEWFAKQVYAGGFAGYIRGRIFENISIYDVKNIHAINNAQYHGSDIENGGNSGSHAGGFAGYINYDKYDKPKFNNIYMYFTPNSIIKSESKLNENYAGKFAGRISVSNNANPNISKIHIYHHKKDLTNATADQKYWGNEIQLHPYDDNNQGYIDFKTATLAALNGLKEIDCGAGRKCLVFTSDFKVDNPNITSPDIPDFNAKQPKPLIPNIEDIINEQATLDTDDIISKNDLEEQIIADLKDKFYIVNINILDELLKAYSKIDKDNPTSKAEFLANYLLSKDKYPDDKERLDIAHSMIQSLDFLLAYQDNGLSEASDDKFANKDTKNTNSKVTSKVVEVYNQTNANKDQVNHFIQTTLNNKVNSINEANENFNTQDYYNRLNELALAYNKYVELINKGLANKNDQAFKDISNRLFALIAQAQGETKTIEELINSFEDLKTQASKNSNGHFIVEGDLQALNIPYPILASIKDNNNGSGEIDKPEKPIDPIEPPIDNKPDFSLSFEQSSTFNSIGNDSLDDEEEQEEIEEASMNQKGKTCIVSDNYRTMNPCVVGGL
ncbi:hypothetical protein [Campylobacter lari]|uniref:hypothetical protein n=1 Tax=Campylobacter lari TaxID=201 RepID=UPI00397BDA40